MMLDQLLTYFSNVRRNGAGYTVDCPCHTSQSGKSLHIKDKGDKLVLHCFGGCETEDILAKVGLSFSDLHTNGNGYHPTPTKPARDKRPVVEPLTWWADYCSVPLEFVKTLPLKAQDSGIAFKFGNLPVVKLRQADSKDIEWHPKGAATPILWPLPGETLPETMWLVEGESDCTIALYIGLPAYAVTKGAGTALSLDQAVALKQRGVKLIVVCFDSDKSGREGAKKQMDVLAEVGLELVTVDLAGIGLIDPLLGQKDLRDAWLILKNPLHLQERLEAAANFVSPTYREGSLERHNSGFVSASELAQSTESSVQWEELLGAKGVVGRGICTLLSARPKSGKTTLVAYAAKGWVKCGLRVAWLTEEPRAKWRERIAKLELEDDALLLGFSNGLSNEDWIENLRAVKPDIIIVDTARTFLGIKDENSAAEVHDALWPVILAARELNAGLMVLHHLRKNPGEEGTDHAGSHAFVGDCDIAISLKEATGRRRELNCRSRFDDTPDKLLVELGLDDDYRVLGHPQEVSAQEVKNRVRLILSNQWQTAKKLLEALEEPKPSDEAVRKALLDLVAAGEAERQLGRGSIPDQWRKLPLSNDPSL